MAHRTGRIKVKREGIAINADVRYAKLNEEDIADSVDVITSSNKMEYAEAPYIVMRKDVGTDGDGEPKKGPLVLSQRQIAESAGDVVDELKDVEGVPAPSGTVKYPKVTEDGDKVESDEIRHWQVKPDGSEVPVKKKDNTVGGGEVLPVEDWISANRTQDFLTSSMFEVYGEEPEDEAQLYELASYIRDSGETPVFTWIWNPSFTEKWAIMVPKFYQETDEFGLFLKITEVEVHGEHDMPMLDEEEAKEIIEEKAEEEGETIEHESPF